jgi:hypothetical protein
MERGKWSGGYLNSFSLSTASSLREATNSLEKAVALLRLGVQVSPIHFFLFLLFLFFPYREPSFFEKVTVLGVSLPLPKVSLPKADIGFERFEQAK